MTLIERILITIAIVEIPIQIDAYLMYHERDALLGAVGGVNISIVTICLIGLYGIWSMQTMTQPHRAKSPLTFGVWGLVYLGAVMVSLFAATLPMLAWFDIALLVQAFLLFFYVANRPRGWQDAKWIIGAMALGLLIEGLIVIGLVPLASDGEMFNVGPIVLGVSPDGRPCGTMHSPVAAGSYLALFVSPVAAVLIIPGHRRLKLLAWLAVIIGVLAVTLTQTRGAIITVFLSIGMLAVAAFWRGWLPKWTPVAVLFLAAISAWPIWHVIQNRIVAGDEGSAVARKNLSLIALRAIGDRPLVGGGSGNCHLICERYANTGRFRSEWYYTIHCKYLLVWVETGIIGLLAFLAFLGDALRRGWATWKVHDRMLSPIGLALVTALLGHMVHMLVDVFNSRSQVQQLWLCVGLIVCLYRLSNAGVTKPVRSYVSFLLDSSPRPGTQTHGA